MALSRKARIVLVATLACIVVVVITGGAILWDGLSDRIEPVDVGIVLGSAVTERGEPSVRLKARLEKAAELYQRHLFKKVLVSGGVDPRGHDEAAIMAEYLRQRGVPAGAILTDSDGRTTWYTAQNAAQILRANGLRTAMPITQYFHISRAKLALRRFGVDCPANAHADVFEARDVYSTFREIVGYYAYLL